MRLSGCPGGGPSGPDAARLSARRDRQALASSRGGGPRRLLSPPAGGSLPRKEVIQPHLPVRLPCYDFTPLAGRTFDTGPLAVGLAASGAPDSDGVTGGVYKARERIHRAMLMRDY